VGGRNKNMEKIQNCPNNTFDCGVGCGLVIMSEAVIEIMKKVKKDDERIKIINEFLEQLHGTVHERHLEHMNQRYEWKEMLNKIFIRK